MSYPRKLHILVVEDDEDVILGYKQFFTTIAKESRLVDPTFARSFDDATKCIEGSNIYHLVILDLNLPDETRQPAETGLARGSQLIEALAKRDSYPVPVLLIVSGRLNTAESISDLESRLKQDFWYGELANKGPAQFKEIMKAIRKAHEYLDVGIHVQDSMRRWFPTISPREEDLLRRCVLSVEAGLGVDVKWWDAEAGQTISRPTPSRGPTKVLMGHFLLDDGLGLSIPTFFKFEPTDDSRSVVRNVAILEQKLAHVKAVHASVSRNRSLVVTQNVTNRGEPISLPDFLHQNATNLVPAIDSIMGQVIAQLEQLGGEHPDQVALKDFLWSHLDRNAIERTWATYEAELSNGSGSNPVEVFDIIKGSSAYRWTAQRQCTHGDLNASNIAIDAGDMANPHAYIFDPGWMQKDLQYRDLAMLEITTILFYAIGVDEVLIDRARAFYDAKFVPDPVECDPVNAFATNVSHMVRAIRSRIDTADRRATYALMLFNAVLQQLSGLTIQPSPNKVRNPFHACRLAAWISRWLGSIVPECSLQGEIAFLPDGTQ